MAPEQINEQIETLKQAGAKACESKESAQQFLKDAGITPPVEDTDTTTTTMQTLLQQLQDLKEQYKDSLYAGIDHATLDAVIAALFEGNRGEDWISVKTGNLPEDKTPCLVNKKYKWVRGDKEGIYYQIQILVFNKHHECWDGEDGDDYNCDIDNVSHYIPLSAITSTLPPQNK